MGQNPSTARKKLVAGRPVVVVIGGGYGGVKLVKELQKTGMFNVILIDRKKFFLHNIGLLRASVEPGHEQKCVLPYERVVNNFVNAEVTSLEPDKNQVRVAGADEPIRYDYCVIATGSSYAFPSKVSEPEPESVSTMFNEFRERLDKAKSVVVVGGGAVGVELCGELRDKYANERMRITLLQSTDVLLGAQFPDKFTHKAHEILLDRGINVLMGERLVMTDELRAYTNRRYAAEIKSIETSKGTTLRADLVIFCMGTKINSGAYEKSLDKSLIDERSKQIHVNQHLQVPGFDNLFALGDCTDADSNFGYVAESEAVTVAKNLVATCRARDSDKQPSLSTYKPAKPMMVLPIGRSTGVSLLPIVGTLGAFATAKIKGEELFVTRYWNTLGYRYASSSIQPTEPLARIWAGNEARESDGGESDDSVKRIVDQNLAAALGVDESQVGSVLGQLEPQMNDEAVDAGHT